MHDEAIGVVKEVSIWAESIGARKKFNIDQNLVNEILSTPPSILNAKTKIELLDMQHTLNCDINNLQFAINDLECIMQYCESNINFITCNEVKNMQDVMKNEMKTLIAAKKDPVCSSLLKLKNKTKLKLTQIENCMFLRNKFLESLDIVLKGKMYDRSN